MDTSTRLSASPLLEIKDLHVHFSVYGGTLRVLEGVNFTVHSGEKIGLVGETGASVARANRLRIGQDVLGPPQYVTSWPRTPDPISPSALAFLPGG